MRSCNKSASEKEQKQNVMQFRDAAQRHEQSNIIMYHLYKRIKVFLNIIRSHQNFSWCDDVMSDLLDIK